jgi:hypothetical protein
MKLFFYILQKLIKTNNIYYPDDNLNCYKMFTKTNYHDDFLNESIYIYLLINDIYNYNNTNLNNLLAKSKLYSLNKFLNNIFISNELKERIFTIYSKAQKIYFNMFRFMNCYKQKKYSFIVTNDLMLNPLDTNSPNIHIIIQNKRKYAFSIHDLINIIESALGNAPMFFPEPLKPKNPYNNFIFTYAELYNIYFKMKYSATKISTMFHLYFLDNYNKKLFAINNELYLRENAIKRFVYKSPSNILYPSVLNMINSNKYTQKLNIHEDFPRDLLVHIFQPFLFYYYIVNYYIKYCEKYDVYYNTLNYKLKKFYNFNPSFGRQTISYIKNKNNKIIDKKYIFNTKYISFYEIKIDDNLLIY